MNYKQLCFYVVCVMQGHSVHCGDNVASFYCTDVEVPNRFLVEFNLFPTTVFSWYANVDQRTKENKEKLRSIQLRFGTRIQEWNVSKLTEGFGPYILYYSKQRHKIGWQLTFSGKLACSCCDWSNYHPAEVLRKHFCHRVFNRRKNAMYKVFFIQKETGIRYDKCFIPDS